MIQPVIGVKGGRGRGHVQSPGATGGGDGVFHAKVGFEGFFETHNVVVAVFAPTVGRGVRCVTDFEFGDGWLGVMDARFHRRQFTSLMRKVGAGDTARMVGFGRV